MLINIDTVSGTKQIRVCNYCRTVCIPSGAYCSARCYHQHVKQMEDRRKAFEQTKLEREQQ